MQASRLLSKCKIIFSTTEICTFSKIYPNKPKKLRWCCSKIFKKTGLISQHLNLVGNTATYLYTSSVSDTQVAIDSITFEQMCKETLDSLFEYIEELVESASHLQSAEITNCNGVLTIAFGPPHGTYLINRQTTIRQLWLSSPTSGPKRYDYYIDNKTWIHKHDGVSLHQLLQSELSKIIGKEVDFFNCAHSS